MPRPRTDKPNRGVIDWTKALILERKKALGLNWADIAEEVGMSPDVLRNLVYKRPTNRWPSYTLWKVCQALGIRYGTYTIKIPEDRK